MKGFKSFLQQHSLMIGILLMFLFTWPIDLANSKILPIQVPFAVYITLGYGFITASLLMTGITQGKKAVVELLKKFLVWRVGWQWYLAAFLLLPGISLLAITLSSLLSGQFPDFSTAFAYKIFGPSASLPALVLPFLLFDALTNGEEMGWRGYALPRLQAKYSPLVATLILGVIWWFWHLPKFLAPGNDSSFGLYLLEMLPKAILYTWVYNHTRGSLLLVTLFHAAGNTAGMFLPTANTISGNHLDILVLEIIIEIVVAGAVVLFSRQEWLPQKRTAAFRETA